MNKLKMAVKACNDGIRLAVEIGDNGTYDLLEGILEDEEEQFERIAGALL